MHSVSGRHIDDRWRNAPGIFLKASETFFLISDLYRVDTENAEVHADIAQSVVKCIIPLFLLEKMSGVFIGHFPIGFRAFNKAWLLCNSVP